MDLEELDIKWQMAMLSVRINRFKKNAELGHFARECTKKQMDSKARYSSFKLRTRLNRRTKALLSFDQFKTGQHHEGEDVENGAAHVYGMIAEAEEEVTTWKCTRGWSRMMFLMLAAENLPP
ncbi:hypothetical protein Tco_0117902 [Tanacetum coccineum]